MTSRKGGAGSSAAVHAEVGPIKLNILLPASGDIRHVIKTVNSLPLDSSDGSTSSGGSTARQFSLSVHINNHNPKVALRNLLVLLLFTKHGHEAADAAAALIFSTALTSDQHLALCEIITQGLGASGEPATMAQRRPPPSISRSLDGSDAGGMSGVGLEEAAIAEGLRALRVEDQAAGAVWFSDLVSRPFPIRISTPAMTDGAQVSVDFLAGAWRLLAGLTAWPIDMHQASEMRTAVMHSRGVVDKLERKLSGQRPFHRVAYNTFRDHGIFMPFGAMDAHHNAPDKTLLTPGYGWMLGDGQDPLDAWGIEDVIREGQGRQLPPNDIYGALYYHVVSQLEEFGRRLGDSRLQVSFQLTCENAMDLAPKLALSGVSFDVVDVSNITDRNYEGVVPTLRAFSPLLNPANPESILVTTFINWTHFLDSPVGMAGAGHSGLTVGEYKYLLRRYMERKVQVGLALALVNGPAEDALAANSGGRVSASGFASRRQQSVTTTTTINNTTTIVAAPPVVVAPAVAPIVVAPAPVVAAPAFGFGIPVFMPVVLFSTMLQLMLLFVGISAVFAFVNGVIGAANSVTSSKEDKWDSL